MTYPIEPLLERIQRRLPRTATKIELVAYVADSVAVSTRTVERKQTLDDREADRWAIRCHLHPDEIWDDYRIEVGA